MVTCTISTFTVGIGTPLHYAAARGLRDSVECLIEAGASPQIKDPAVKLTMDWAEFNGHTNMAEFPRPLSVGHDLELVPQFTSGDGRYLRHCANGEIPGGKRLSASLIVLQLIHLSPKSASHVFFQ